MLVVWGFYISEIIKVINKSSKCLIFYAFPVSITGSQGHY